MSSCIRLYSSAITLLIFALVVLVTSRSDAAVMGIGIACTAGAVVVSERERRRVYRRRQAR